MERLILPFLYAVLAMVTSGPAFAQENWFPIPSVNAADMLPYERGGSFLHPGSFGAGNYPFRMNTPSVCAKADVDGIPIPSFSPFGPNIGRTPVLFVDSLSVDRNGGIRIATIDSIPAAPVTRLGFLSGERQRFNFQGTLSRKITENSGIFVGGAADGIRGNDLIPGNAFRLYRIRYVRVLENTGVLTATVDGDRDRTDIYDLSSGSSMGKRTIDGIQYVAGLDGYQIGLHAMLSSSLYYRNGVARFKRSGTGTTFDDDSFGGTIRITALGKRSSRSLVISNDTRGFTARTAGPDWDANTTTLSTSGNWAFSRANFSADAGVRYSSEYGTGGLADVSVELPVARSVSVVLRGSFSHRFPDPGTLFYPSLTYSDTLVPSTLSRYWTSETEAGIEGKRGNLRFGIYGFVSRANAPVFTSIPATMVMSGNEHYSGGRLTLGISGARAVDYDGSASVEYTGGSTVRTVWPRPVFLARAKGSIARYYFQRNLHASLYGSARVEHYVGTSLPPDGTDLFVNTGLAFNVATVTLFYEVENLTGTKLRWFDAYEVQGMNSFWGVRWNLLN